MDIKLCDLPVSSSISQREALIKALSWLNIKVVTHTATIVKKDKCKM